MYYYSEHVVSIRKHVFGEEDYSSSSLVTHTPAMQFISNTLLLKRHHSQSLKKLAVYLHVAWESCDGKVLAGTAPSARGVKEGDAVEVGWHRVGVGGL